MSEARVGIVVRVFNTDADQLREAVHSALAQTVPVDVVVVDDGSTNGATLEALDDLTRPNGAGGARLLRHSTNRGPGVAMNTGVDALDTPYVFPMDSDDLVEPTYAELAADVLDSRPEVSIVTTNIALFGEASGLDSASGAPNGSVDMLLYNVIPAFSIFRRTDWEAVGGYADLRWYEDYDFWLRVLSLGGVSFTLPTVQYHYRVHPAQVTATISWEQKLRQQLEIVRRNPEVWQGHIEVVMEHLWRQQVELNYYKKRYGRINDMKKGLIDRLLIARSRLTR